MGEEPGSGAAAGNRVIGRRRGNHCVASPARPFLADMPHHLEAARHVIERLSDLFANPAQRAAASRAHARRGMYHVLAWEVFRQGMPCRLLSLNRRLDHCSDDRRGGRDPLGLVALQCFDRQLELLGLARQLLRGAAELGAPVARQLEAQLGDLGLRRDGILGHRRDDRLQRFRLIGKLIGRDPHTAHRITSAAVWRGRTPGRFTLPQLSRQAPAAPCAPAAASRSPPTASTAAPASIPPRPARRAAI
jgi:hypothetical protein